MSTNKNTFKYLCLVFGFTITHLMIRVLIWNFVPENSMFTPLFYILLADIPLTALILYFFLYYSGKFTGFSLSSKRIKPILTAVFGCMGLALLISAISFFILMTGMMLLSVVNHFALPTVQLLGIMLITHLGFILCKLAMGKNKVLFPKGMFWILSAFPAIIYFLLGIILVLVDNSISSMDYSGLGTFFLFYFFAFYAHVHEICIGWSIFCMMKYNQGMKIKKLLEMQAKLL